MKHRSLLLSATALALSVPSLAIADYASHYRSRVAQFRTENANLPAGRQHIVLVGDSLTEGWKFSDRVSRYMPQVASRVLNRGISSDGMSRANSRGIVNRLRESIWDCNPSHVVMLVGTNDVHSNGGGVAGSARHYENVVREIRQRLPQTRVIMVLVPPARGQYSSLNPHINTYNGRLRTIAADHGAQVLDLHQLLRDGNGRLRSDLTSDGIHWTHAGYRIYGAALEPMLLDGSAPPAPTTTTPSQLDLQTHLGFLRRGDRGPRVERLQEALLALGFDLGSYCADGVFGGLTDTAVRDFQRQAGIGVDGVVGPETERALRAALAALQPAPVAPSGGISGALPFGGQ